MSMAEREAKWAIRWTRWAGQSRLVQKVSLSPSRRVSGPRSSGRWWGSATALAGRPRRGTGPTTSGITSPALRTTTVSPGRTSFRRTWSSLWSVASPTVEPPTKTGSSTANGRGPAGPPDRHLDGPSTWWCAPRAGTCRRWPIAGRREVAPSSALQGESSTLMTTPSIS